MMNGKGIDHDYPVNAKAASLGRSLEGRNTQLAGPNFVLVDRIPGALSVFNRHPLGSTEMKTCPEIDNSTNGEEVIVEIMALQHTAVSEYTAGQPALDIAETGDRAAT